MASTIRFGDYFAVPFYRSQQVATVSGYKERGDGEIDNACVEARTHQPIIVRMHTTDGRAVQGFYVPPDKAQAVKEYFEKVDLPHLHADDETVAREHADVDNEYMRLSPWLQAKLNSQAELAILNVNA